MLDADLKAQLQAYLERVTMPIELVASLDDSDNGRQMRALLTDIASLSAKISVVEQTNARTPSFAIRRVGTSGATEIAPRFAAIPMGHEFTSLVLALLQVGGHPPKLEPEVIEQIRALNGNFSFEIYMSLTCQNCPDVVQALNVMSVINPGIKVVSVDGGLFPAEVEQRQIMAVPTVYLNGEVFGQGRMGVAEILAKLDTGAAQRDAAKLNDKAPYDVLIIGGGPAGATAAVYAARKGIRTGIVAERFGGQVQDTLGIENYPSVLHTEGPQFAAALEQQVRANDVELLLSQRVKSLVPVAAQADTASDKLIRVELESGATLRSKTVILSTGARWRELNVPGEQNYRNRGVAYCPHCDGPLFKGKRVAVAGGGNSGVEAAIDLAGIVSHVTLVEFMPELKADAVLVRKLESLPNVTILRHTQIAEVLGDGSKVNGLKLVDRASGDARQVELEGLFVQIGLVPNTEFLKGTLELSKYGEVVVDAKGQTSVPGVFAAGDATTVPFKQIIIAAGEGAKAALSAFDHLIRA